MSCNLSLAWRVLVKGASYLCLCVCLCMCVCMFRIPMSVVIKVITIKRHMRAL